MIPKIIHYCWFGGKEIPEEAKRCIDSWAEYLPDYRVMIWSEDTYDLSVNQYVQEAYAAEKYAFVTDYVRLDVLFRFGGIYMDTDVEVVKPLDKYLEHKAFSGFENVVNIPTGIIGSEKGNKIIGELQKDYENRPFVLTDGSYDLTTNVEIITNYFLKRGLRQDNSFQVIDGFAFYPNIVFCPYKHEYGTKYIADTSTYHHKYGSWIPPERRVEFGRTKNGELKVGIKRIALLLLGKERLDRILLSRFK